MSPIHEVISSAAQFSRAAEFQAHASHLINETESYRELVYTDVPKDWGWEIVDHLNDTVVRPCRKHYDSAKRVFWVRVMPEEIHDCHQKWWHDQLCSWISTRQLAPNDLLDLWPGAGTTFSCFQGEYVGSRHEPDFFLRWGTIRMPKFVIETGWNESWSRLQDDMNLWLVGGAGDVGGVLLLKWHKVGNSNKVRGKAELYGLDQNGMPVRKESKIIFPVPPQPNNILDQISLPRRILFGPGSQGVLDWNMNDLRRIATTALGFMSLVPA
ncbi:hypothetical protein BDV38DRAFT_285006 [Aspergillus pseudotamarii]|uniref:Uncharacterized protein n=1 Tax=Aspergillus pseudotamarii TaxID=132259 RepID=A0A5N6SL13_ASPPS|nr:uncharacterized protein BDV38DRAFT_285006 [Aspergillus pseudotamarii]KAE8135372.1 hypothetical protein BDV38DRAFT_285006 [Aspergillus pseudotamarii]